MHVETIPEYIYKFLDDTPSVQHVTFAFIFWYNVLIHVGNTVHAAPLA